MSDHNLPVGSQAFRHLSLITSAWTLLLIFVGALERIIGTGSNAAGPVVMAHRLVAGVAVLLTLAVAVAAWCSYRRYCLIFIPAAGAAGLALGQAYLGQIAAWSGGSPPVIAAHLLVAVAYLALTLIVTTVAHLPARAAVRAGVSGRVHTYYFRFLLLTGATLVLLALTGATVTGSHTGLACRDWPLCQGEIFPAGANLSTIINLLHRFTVIGAGVVIAAVVLQSRRRYLAAPLLVKWSTYLGLIFLAQIGLGGLNVLTHFPVFINAIHLLLALAIWGCLVILATIFYVTASTLPVAADEEKELKSVVPVREKAVVYFKLTKPWVMILLLVTTLGAMFIAAKGVPPISLMLYTLLGGALSAGGASVLNSYIDSDIDQVMSRTSRRPTVTGLVTPQETLFFGLALSTLSFVVFAAFVNLLSAALSTLGILYYVFFYTLYLKRATIHNIIIGGAAGSIPPLVGWAAVTGRLDLSALYLFAIIFFWTPPHTWALALLVKKDYARARVPMLPVVAGDQETTYQIFLYSILLIALTLLPFAGQMMSVAYLVAAILLGIPFIYLAWKLWQDYSKRSSKQLYKFSQLYLALLFLIMALDRSLF